MKNIFLIIVVLVIGFAIGGFTQSGNKLFSFLGNTDNPVNINEAINKQVAGIKTAAQNESGKVFDKEYLDSMILLYEGTSTISKVGTVAAGHPELRSIAKVVNKDDAQILIELKKMRDNWYPADTAPKTKPSFVK